MSQCFKLKSKGNKPDTQGTGCVLSSRYKEAPLPPKVVGDPPKNSGDTPVGRVFKPFVSEGMVSLEGRDKQVQIKIARDTCCATTVIVDSVLPFDETSFSGQNVLLQGIDMETIMVPLHKVNLKSGLITGEVTVAVRPELPIKGVHMLLGNDLAGKKVFPDPIVIEKPVMKLSDGGENEENFPQCAITRAMSKKLNEEITKENLKKPVKKDDLFDVYTIDDTFFGNLEETPSAVDGTGPPPRVESDSVRDIGNDPLTYDILLREQGKDPVICKLGERAVSLEETEQVPVCFYTKNGVLMRKYRPPSEPANEQWQVIHQIIVPKIYQNEVLNIAHDSPMGGHLGVRKTRDKIWKHFWWPTLTKDVSDYCRTCHVCQMIGKPNQGPPIAPLKPIPAFEEPFSRVIIDCVGPLPKTKSGHEYLLTIMCASTRFPEAIPLRNIKAASIAKALIKFFYICRSTKIHSIRSGVQFYL
jgi:hypothetical protein